MSSDDIAISVRNLTKSYRIFNHAGERLKHAISLGMRRYHREFTAVRDASFDIKKGEAVGIIGRNGSGKSTLLQLICGILKPTAGTVHVNGRVAALLELGAGFNPEFTGRENVYFQGSLMGLSRSEVDARFDSIAEFADIGQFIDQPVRTYSSGMFVRLAFAVSVHVDPDILLIDEALSVGDIDFQAKSLARMRELMSKGVTVLFVSHSMQAVSSYCSRVLLLENGTLCLDGSPAEAIERHRGQFNASTQVDLRSCTRGRRGLRTSIELLELSVAQADRHPSHTFAMGDRLLLTLALRTASPVPQARFGILVTNSSDTLIHDIASAYSEIVGIAAPGVHRFEITTDPLMVYPGTYYLGAWAQTSFGTPSDDYVRAALTISVEDRGKVGGHDARFNWITKANTEVYLPCTWRPAS